MLYTNTWKDASARRREVIGASAWRCERGVYDMGEIRGILREKLGETGQLVSLGQYPNASLVIGLFVQI